MKKIAHKYSEYFSDKSLSASVLLSIVLFVASIFISYAATTYATERAGGAVQDLILSNIPVVNVDFIVNEGVGIFTTFILVVILLEPKRIPVVLKSAALFVLVRSVAVTLTHIGQFPVRSYIDQTSIFGPLNIGADLFFSGHAGLPFLMALIFWKNKFVRNVSLASSCIFAVSVLLGHLHYSIDVFAAYFITYTIFHISQKFFPRDYKLLAD